MNTMPYKGYTARIEFDERDNIAQIPVNNRIAGGMVFPDGKILTIVHDPVAVVIFRPRSDNGMIDWECSGIPVGKMPSVSRNPFSF